MREKGRYCIIERNIESSLYLLIYNNLENDESPPGHKKAMHRGSETLTPT